LLNIRPGLTALAAGGLVIIMIGATAVSIISGMAAAAFIPALTGLLAAFVAYGRWQRREAAKADLHQANFGKEPRWQSE
jgi:hypothetical protein